MAGLGQWRRQCVSYLALAVAWAGVAAMGGAGCAAGSSGTDEPGAETDAGEEPRCELPCTTEDERQCYGSGYRVCNPVPSVPGCLSWSEFVACTGDDVCRAGHCQAPGCQDACAPEGQTECVDGGSRRVCTRPTDGACLQWSEATPCGEDETCTAGVCAGPGCVPECEAVGDSECDGDLLRVCGDPAGDGCLVWADPVACPPDESCSEGECLPDCADECLVDEVRCAGDDLQRCGQYDEDDCREWGEAKPCPEAGQTCVEAQCVTPCVDECTVGAQQCTVDGREQACAEPLAADGCRAWGAPTACPAGESCDPDRGRCAPPSCSNLCEAGRLRCTVLEDGVQRCADLNHDGCTEWGPASPCAGGTSCADGSCLPSCADECLAGAGQCQDELHPQRCGDDNDDGCTEWVTAGPCAAGSHCITGGCVDCSPCTVDDGQCVDSTHPRTCVATAQGNGCTEWVASSACSAGTLCEAGDCVDCSPCAVGEKRCADATHQQTCVASPAGAGCTAWGPSSLCDAGGQCETNGCVAPGTPPGGVVISELLYDGASGDTDEAFIELHGAPGTPLDGYWLEGVNGHATATDDPVYSTIELTGQRIPDDGYFVIAHPEASSALLAIADLLRTEVDYQNGKDDSVSLMWEGQLTVDALCYDREAACLTGEGEAAPAAKPASASGPSYSLTRNAANADTDDNASDFTVAIPSPGGPPAP